MLCNSGNFLNWNMSWCPEIALAPCKAASTEETSHLPWEDPANNTFVQDHIIVLYFLSHSLQALLVRNEITTLCIKALQHLWDRSQLYLWLPWDNKSVEIWFNAASSRRMGGTRLGELPFPKIEGHVSIAPCLHVDGYEWQQAVVSRADCTARPNTFNISAVLSELIFELKNAQGIERQ